MGAELTHPPLTAKRADAGVTLVELLVVVAVLAVLGVGSSIMAFRGDGSDAAHSDHAWFQANYERARLLAIEARSPRGLNITASGLQRLSFGPDGWEGDAPARKWQGRVTLANQRPRPRSGMPDIMLLANGQSTAFTINFHNGVTARQRCETDGWTGLQCSGG